WARYSAPSARSRCARPGQDPSWACWPWTASGCRWASPSPGCARRDHPPAADKNGVTVNRGSAITGIGCYAPEVVVTNADLEKVFDTSDQWIIERTGIKERRVMSWGPAPHSPVDSTATMAAAAGQAAMDAAGAGPDDIDLLI